MAAVVDDDDDDAFEEEEEEAEDPTLKVDDESVSFARFLGLSLSPVSVIVVLLLLLLVLRKNDLMLLWDAILLNKLLLKLVVW